MKFRLDIYGSMRVLTCIYIYIPNAKLYLIKNAVKIKWTERGKKNKCRQLHHFISI